MEKTQEKSFEQMNWEAELLSLFEDTEESIQNKEVQNIQINFDLEIN